MRYVMVAEDGTFIITFIDVARDAAIKSGLVKADQLEWMVDLACKALTTHVSETQCISIVKSQGGLLTSEEKRDLGVNARLKLGRRLVEALTDTGRADPNAAVKSIIGSIYRVYGNAANLHAAKRRGVPLEMKIPLGDAACSAAAEYWDKVVPTEEAPDFPLPGCDRQFCECRMEVSYDGLLHADNNEEIDDIDAVHDPALVEISPAPRPVTVVRTEPASGKNDTFIFVAAALIVLIFAIFVSMR